jgi:aspartate aminotransferase
MVLFRKHEPETIAGWQQLLEKSMVKHSATLALNEKVAARQAAGRPVIHLGFGEAGLPVAAEIAAVLADAAGANAYAPASGTPEARRSAARYFTRRDLPTDTGQVMLAPGSKALLYAALAALPGDLVLPVPSWVSYAAQAELTGKRVIGVPIPVAAGGIPDPQLLEQALWEARAAGAQPGIMMLTLPDNPTGTLADRATLKQVCALAEQHDLIVIADEIYRDLAHDPAEFLSPASLLPERTLVTSGLSKNMALGGWRIGFARLPEGPIGRRLHHEIVGMASEIWSSMPAPMQAVAAYVLNEPLPVREHIAAARRLHAAIAGAVHMAFTGAGAVCRPPTAAFYCYPDFEALRPALEAQGLYSGAALAEHLLDEHGVAVLAGEHFGDNPRALRLRVASSLLYGESAEQRRQALNSAEPLALPWIADALSGLRTALAALA